MKRVKFVVVGYIDNNIDFNRLVLTSHWKDERIERHNKIVEIIGNGNLISSFEVDTGHPNGNEIHNVFSNGIILIQNKESGLLVTELIARPQQLKRYWEQLGFEFPEVLNETVLKAFENQKKKYNYW